MVAGGWATAMNKLIDSPGGLARFIIIKDCRTCVCVLARDSRSSHTGRPVQSDDVPTTLPNLDNGRGMSGHGACRASAHGPPAEKPGGPRYRAMASSLHLSFGGSAGTVRERDRVNKQTTPHQQLSPTPQSISLASVLGQNGATAEKPGRGA